MWTVWPNNECGRKINCILKVFDAVDCYGRHLAIHLQFFCWCLLREKHNKKEDSHGNFFRFFCEDGNNTSILFVGLKLQKWWNLRWRYMMSFFFCYTFRKKFKWKKDMMTWNIFSHSNIFVMSRVLLL